MITPKVWGHETEVVNDVYCGKILHLKEQYRCSIHKHAVKDEVIMVWQGCVMFEVGSDPDNMTKQFFQDGDKVRLTPGTWHRFTGLRDSVLIEWSTHHQDSDSIRHAESGKVGDDYFRALHAEFYRSQLTERVISVDQARIIAKDLHAAGRTVGMCNGCFDLLHVGHLALLEEAKGRCDALFVAMNTDDAVKKLKGANRPFNNEVQRAAMLSATRFVDYVVVCPATSCIDVVEAIEPNVYVTTSEYGNTGPEARETMKQGGVVEVIDMVPGFSTSAAATKIALQGKTAKK
jgi:D-glycero-beta-D-manno-heptose 1-phosphate adenylyltransferase